MLNPTDRYTAHRSAVRNFFSQKLKELYGTNEFYIFKRTLHLQFGAELENTFRKTIESIMDKEAQTPFPCLVQRYGAVKRLDERGYFVKWGAVLETNCSNIEARLFEGKIKISRQSKSTEDLLTAQIRGIVSHTFQNSF